MKKSSFLSIAFFGSLAVSSLGTSFCAEKVFAEETRHHEGGYAYTCTDTTKNTLFFLLEETTAPYGDWAVRYRPTSDSNVVLTRNGSSYNISTNHNVDMLCKADQYDSYSRYTIETWWMGDYKPQSGDIYKIQGTFTAHDTTSDGKYAQYEGETLSINATSFLYSENNERAFFSSLPQTYKEINNDEITVSTQTLHFLFDVPRMVSNSVPVGGDEFSFYPTSVNNFFIDGKAVANPYSGGLRRREAENNLFYVSLEDQGLANKIEVGSVFIIDGQFTYSGDFNSYTGFNKFGLNINEAAFLKTGSGQNDYQKIVLADYLTSLLRDEFDTSFYSGSTKEAVIASLNSAESNIHNASGVVAKYSSYSNAREVLADYEMDEEAAKEFLLRVKDQAKEELDNYIEDYSAYFESDASYIRNIISEAKENIDAANNKELVATLLAGAKTSINSVAKKIDKAKDVILNQREGYEEYLEKYDVVSLSDLNIESSLTIHGQESERERDLDTNCLPQSLQNTFASSKDNENGNVVFNFKYQHGFKPQSAANFMVNLRGVAYYGYKVGFGSNSNGVIFERLEPNSDSTFLGGIDDVFTIGQEYNVSVGAIDIKETNLVWIFVRVNGNIIPKQFIVERLSFCVNNRVGLSSNYGISDVNGTALVSAWEEGKNEKDSVYGGRLTAIQGHSDARTNLYVSLPKNSLQYDENQTNHLLYATNKDNIIHLSGGLSKNVAKLDIPLISKYSETNYQIYLSKVANVSDGDQIIVQGTFASFDSDESTKTLLTIAKSTFIYHTSSNTWELVLTLEEAKEDAILRINNYVDINNYDETEKNEIQSIISSGLVAIEASNSIATVEETLTNSLSQIDSVKTILRKLQDTFILSVEEYKNDELDNYREDELERMALLKANAIDSILKTSNRDEMSLILINLKADIDNLKTNAEYEVEELQAAKYEAILTIQNHYAEFNFDNLSDNQIIHLNKDTQDAINSINNAASIEEVDRITADYINNHKISKGGCGGSIIIASSVISIISLVGITLLLLRKRHN